MIHYELQFKFHSKALCTSIKPLKLFIVALDVVLQKDSLEERSFQEFIGVQRENFLSPLGKFQPQRIALCHECVEEIVQIVWSLYGLASKLCQFVHERCELVNPLSNLWQCLYPFVFSVVSAIIANKTFIYNAIELMQNDLEILNNSLGTMIRHHKDIFGFDFVREWNWLPRKLCVPHLLANRWIEATEHQLQGHLGSIVIRAASSQICRMINWPKYVVVELTQLDTQSVLSHFSTLSINDNYYKVFK